MGGMEIKFMSVTGKFKIVKQATFENLALALAAVVVYAKEHGYSDVRIVENNYGYRFTAKTPGGRSGRNIAFGDPDVSGLEW